MEIKIENELYAVLAGRAKERGYASTEEYINFLLKQIAEKINCFWPKKNEEVYTEEDQKKIKQRLQSLGYID